MYLFKKNNILYMLSLFNKSSKKATNQFILRIKSKGYENISDVPKIKSALSQNYNIIGVQQNTEEDDTFELSKRIF